MSNHFDTEYLKADLKGRSVRSGAVTMAAQGIKFFLQMCSTVILARLLTPEDYGLIAMVAVVINFAMMFKDMGLSMATVQKAEINHDQITIQHLSLVDLIVQRINIWPGCHNCRESRSGTAIQCDKIIKCCLHLIFIHTGINGFYGLDVRIGRDLNGFFQAHLKITLVLN